MIIIYQFSLVRQNLMVLKIGHLLSYLYLNPFSIHSFVFEILHWSLNRKFKKSFFFLYLPYHQIDSFQVCNYEDQGQTQDYVYRSLQDFLPMFDDYLNSWFSFFY